MKNSLIALVMCLSSWAMAGNLLKNGDFSNGLQFWKSSVKTIAIDPVAKFNNKNVVCMVNESRLHQVVKLEENTDYELSYAVKGDNVSPTARTNSGVCIVLNGGGVWDRTTPLANNRRMTGTFDWQQRTYSFNSSKFKNKPLMIRLEINANGKCCFADIRLVKAVKSSGK